jgi:hypothetical protein
MCSVLQPVGRVDGVGRRCVVHLYFDALAVDDLNAGHNAPEDNADLD